MNLSYSVWAHCVYHSTKSLTFWPHIIKSMQIVWHWEISIIRTRRINVQDRTGYSEAETVGWMDTNMHMLIFEVQNIHMWSDQWFIQCELFSRPFLLGGKCRERRRIMEADRSSGQPPKANRTIKNALTTNTKKATINEWLSITPRHRYKSVTTQRRALCKNVYAPTISKSAQSRYIVRYRKERSWS